MRRCTTTARAARRAPPAAAGRPGRRRVRGFNWAPATVLGVTLPALLVPDGRLRSRRWRAVAAMMAAAGTLLWMATMVASVVCVVLRFRSSHGVECQQLRWVAAGAAGAVAGLLAGSTLPQNTVLSGRLIC